MVGFQPATRGNHGYFLLCNCFQAQASAELPPNHPHYHVPIRLIVRYQAKLDSSVYCSQNIRYLLANPKATAPQTNGTITTTTNNKDCSFQCTPSPFKMCFLQNEWEQVTRNGHHSSDYFFFFYCVESTRPGIFFFFPVCSQPDQETRL